MSLTIIAPCCQYKSPYSTCMVSNKFFISIEFALLCIALPTYIWATNSGEQMFAFLWVAFAYTAIILWRLKHISIRDEWRWSAVNWDNIKPMLIRWVIATILICGFTWFYEPSRLFFIPREAPHIIPFLLLAYPILSALPQEFIFCSFFMKRYGQYIKSDWTKIIISAIVFGYAHMLFLNWVAPVFSFFGGVIFAYTYLKTKSLALVTIEHSLYGNSIFLAGIGYYFYSGGIGQ
jgi:membrane protease YdiL (CAAX protease family)